MDDLIKELQEKTGLDVDKIKSVIEGVAGFLSGKLPGPLGDQVGKLLGGGGDDDDQDAGGDDGGLLGQAKDMLDGVLGGA